MADKTTKKKKAYQAFCREQVKAGKINNTDGTWINYSESGTYAAMHKHQRAGYKIR